MIALGILTIWLVLTAAGFAGLSALRRAGTREEAYETSEIGRHPSEPQATFADMRLPIPAALLR